MTRDWDDHYASGDIRWDRDGPDPELVRLIEAGRLPRGRALDIGCGTGTTARYLAGLGYHVLGIDLSRLAIERAAAAAAPAGGTVERAAAAAAPAGGTVELRQLDFLHEEPDASLFDLVFDRGCFHVFDDPDDRSRFARRVAGCLSPEGIWLSFLGSTEGPPRDEGPPRRSARDIAAAVEPALEIVELRGFTFNADLPRSVSGWVLIARLRDVPAQPSTVQEE
jgi:SAM-dependent methyltransferase